MSTYLSAESIRAIESILNYEFHDKSLLDKAFEAPGATEARGGHQRQALIGDAALKLVLTELGYEGNASTGEITISRDSRVSNENLKRLGESLGLNAYFRLNPSSQGVVPRSMMATTMEAIIGAVYLDSGKDMATTRALVNRLGI
ncbi:hypothetical protein N7522_006301 [Penicillium canescens]|uniref:RNase III domain-containing protein n=1 Tax=Penicillium nordicum TaxID=229535 RepID=A0A0M9W9M5_9EURO|nr:hypothetical protein N7522_006301 [Penicillium canescens]KOS36562.1 hypothetical protein ACN38_g12687 [Penicillium nordicum]